MKEAKLQKIGNSLGFRIPKEILNTVGFQMSDDYEIISSRGAITIIKREKHHSKWKFEGTEFSEEDKLWLEADLGEEDVDT